MKRKEFKIKTDQGWVVVSGWMSGYFGCHKNAEGMYVVTHLITGLKIAESKSIEAIKESVIHLNGRDWPTSWDNLGVKDLKEKNGKQLLNLIKEVGA